MRKYPVLFFLFIFFSLQVSGAWAGVCRNDTTRYQVAFEYIRNNSELQKLLKKTFGSGTIKKYVQDGRLIFYCDSLSMQTTIGRPVLDSMRHFSIRNKIPWDDSLKAKYSSCKTGSVFNFKAYQRPLGKRVDRTLSVYSSKIVENTLVCEAAFVTGPDQSRITGNLSQRRVILYFLFNEEDTLLMAWMETAYYEDTSPRFY